jgi:hypothetical protein
MDLDRDAPAGEWLAADVVLPPTAGRWAAVRVFLAGIALAIFDEQGSEPGPPTLAGSLVVTRLDTGETVLETDLRLHPIVDDDAGTDHLGYVRGQLEELTVGEFLDRWGVEPAEPAQDAGAA